MDHGLGRFRAGYLTDAALAVEDALLRVSRELRATPGEEHAPWRPSLGTIGHPEAALVLDFQLGVDTR